MRNYFTIAGRDSRDFGIYISGQGTFNSPQKLYEQFSIPGRNGSIFGSDRRLENVELTYPCFIYDNFKENIAAFRTFLLSLDGYQRLEDTYHPDEFRMAVFSGPLIPEVTGNNKAGSFDLTFNCKPQRFLITGESEYYFDGLNTSITGKELTISEPSYVGTYELPIEIKPSSPAFANITDPDFVKYGTVDNPLNIPFGLLGNAHLKINGVSIQNFDLNPGYDYVVVGSGDLTDGTFTASISHVDLDPYWYHVSGNIFGSLVPMEYSKIKACSHYEPVASQADLTGATGKVCVIQDNILVYDPRFSDIDSFQTWISTANLRIIAEYSQPQQETFTPYVSDYPDDPFIISISQGYGVDVLITLPYASINGMINPTEFASRPMIRVVGTGACYINGITINVSDCTSYVDIDCDMMDCYEGSTNRNKDVTFSTYDFPVLSPGANPIIVNGPTSVTVTPRWWRV